MKSGIHPKYNKLTVICSNKKSFETMSTSRSGTIKLDTDPYNHQAWNKNIRITENTQGTVAKFNTKMGTNFFNEDILK